MNRARQDAWTEEEDVLLAEIVLSHIRNGQTQLEAFKQAGEKLSRTAAACGFRWNATIRKNHEQEINSARNKRKQNILKNTSVKNEDEHHTIESAISMLERVKEQVSRHHRDRNEDLEQMISKLQAENEHLKTEIKRYKEAWSEMKHLWEWIEKQNEH